MQKNNGFCANFYLNELTKMPENRKLYEIFFYAAGCVLKNLQKLCHLVIRLPIIKRKVSKAE